MVETIESLLEALAKCQRERRTPPEQQGEPEN